METTKTTRLFTIALAALSLAGCQESKLKGLEGRWSGSITCFEATSELTMSVQVEGDLLTGAAQSKTKGNSKPWGVRGGSAASCQEDTCRSSRDCPLGFESDAGSVGELRECTVNKVCLDKCKGDDSGACDPCKECEIDKDRPPCQVCDRCREDWLPIHVTLSDDDIQIPDPTLKLWRYGDWLLKGSIEHFCLDEASLYPVVEINKD